MTRPTRIERLILAGILLVAIGLNARGITDEASVMLSGDMARYMMDGVFLHDLARAGGAWSFQDLVDFAERYYARYPALSLGHHAPLTFAALLPFYTIFGVTVLAARLSALMFFVLATWGLFTLARRLFDWRVAAWATLLFVTNLLVFRFGQFVLSEMPMVALVLAAFNALLIYCDTQKPRHFVWFFGALLASLYAKQLAFFVFPVYLWIFVTRLGWRQLTRRHVWLTTLAGAVLVAPLVIMTVALAPKNVKVAASAATSLLSGTRRKSLPEILGMIFGSHLSLPALLAVVAGAGALAWRRDRRVLIGVIWAVSVIIGTLVFAGGVEPARYAFGALPAYCLLAAGLMAAVSTTTWRWVATGILAVSVLWQLKLLNGVGPSGAGGYEQAAEYVVAHSEQPVVMFDTNIDTGYFVFYVRKHDPSGRLVLIRADKVLTAPVDAAALANPSNFIYTMLENFGVQYVVVEERSKGAPMLLELHSQLRSDRFIERQRIPIVSHDARVFGVNLVLYEFKDAVPPNLATRILIDLPKGNRAIKLRLGDVIGT
jgi:hypothetical protein